jgi:hypothetical protein
MCPSFIGPIDLPASLKAWKSQRIVVDSLGFSFGVASFGFVEKRTFFLAQRLTAESLNLKSYKAQ